MNAAAAEETLHLILKLSNRLLAAFSVHLERKYEISVNEFRVLILTGRHPNIASHEMVEITGVNAMSVSRAVAALQRHGRLRIETDPQNKRRKTLLLTDEGRRLYNIMAASTDRVAEYLLEALSVSDKSSFDNYLDRMTATVEALDADGQPVFLVQTKC